MTLTDKRIVLSQTSRFHSLLRKTSIKEIKHFTEDVLNEIPSLGSNPYIKKKFYIEQLREFKRKDKNYLLLSDNSIITLFYIFDEKGKIKGHSLSYIPDVEDELSFIERTNSDEPEAYNDYFNEQISKYIRVDYSNEGNEEYFHSLVHMHNGLINNDFRFPFSSYLYPNEFIYLILKYLYRNNDESLESISEFNLLNRKIKLTDNENKKFFASLGIIHQ